MRGWGPVVEIERREGGYIATLKDESREWVAEAPVPRRDLSAKLADFGMHWRDMDDLLRSVDRAWLREHPDEHDPDEYFTISRRPDSYKHRYTMMSERREGFLIQDADTPEDVVRQLVERGFAQTDVETRLEEVESLWERDIATGRTKPNSLDVERRGSGYVWRGFGDAWVRDDPCSAEQLKRMLYFHNQAELDRLIARADEEWEERNA